MTPQSPASSLLNSPILSTPRPVAVKLTLLTLCGRPHYFKRRITIRGNTGRTFHRFEIQPACTWLQPEPPRCWRRNEFFMRGGNLFAPFGPWRESRRHREGSNDVAGRGDVELCSTFSLGGATAAGPDSQRCRLGRRRYGVPAVLSRLERAAVDRPNDQGWTPLTMKVLLQPEPCSARERTSRPQWG